MADVYADYDLGEFDEELRGQMIPLLQNPTRAFRMAFLTGTGDAFISNVAYVMNTDAAGIEDKLGAHDNALFIWLFVPTVDDGKIQLPQVYKVWDAYTVARVKALRAPLVS